MATLKIRNESNDGWYEFGAEGPTGPTGSPGPQGPAGVAVSGAYSEDGVGFAGFTATQYNGGELGGRPSMHAACAAEFANGSMCHYAEYILATSTALIPTEGAWIDPSEDETAGFANSGGPGFGRRTSSSNCNDWTHTVTGTYNGYFVDAAGGGLLTSYCDVTRPIACCNGIPRVQFAGFTATTYLGGTAGGRPARHGHCNDAFPGSHMCHYAEYLRTRSTATIPGDGAWLDPSEAPDGSFSNAGLPSAGRRTASSNCNHWTHTISGTYNGYYVDSPGGGLVTAYCDNLKSIACCYGP